jgi:mannitol/fructose-specific phosphotransferase system IIA component (Ntr-type)
MSEAGASRFLVSDAVRASAIKLRLAARQRDDALQELVEMIAEIAGSDEARQTLLRALQEREALHSTGIGDGIALPHARNALVGLVNHPVIVFGRHEQGIAYGAIDGQPARLFFLIVAPTVTQHLAILARISRMLRNPKLRQSLLAADQPGRVLTLLREAEAEM